MSYPRQIRWLAKWLAIIALFLVLLLGLGIYAMRGRVSAAQQVYDSVAIGDAWSALPGFEERTVYAEPGSVPDGRRRYWRVVSTPYLPFVWEITVDADGKVIGKHRYD